MRKLVRLIFLVVPSLLLLFLPQVNAAGAAVDSLTCGKQCMKRGQYKHALSDFQMAVKKSPKSCEGHLLLGQVYCKLKQYKSGKEQLRLAIRYGHGSTNAQQANIEMMKLPQEVIAPKTGPETQKFVPILSSQSGRGISPGPTVIDFYASWCNPCQQLHTILEKAKVEYGDKLSVIRVDVDDEKNQNLIDQYDVSPIPTLVYLDAHGQVVSFSIGYSGEAAINQQLKKILASGL